MFMSALPSPARSIRCAPDRYGARRVHPHALGAASHLSDQKKDQADDEQHEENPYSHARLENPLDDLAARQGYDGEQNQSQTKEPLKRHDSSDPLDRAAAAHHHAID